MSDTEAIVQTVDFFPPMVDDAFTFGQIAAANALSDVYAMGGVPFVAMNLLCFPPCIDVEIAGKIMAGGLSKVQEAGAIIAGGHTIQDNEPKYGLCVTGRVHPNKIWRNGGAKIGDVIVLTKPIGSGVLNTAFKADFITQAQHLPAVNCMVALNKTSSEVAQNFEVHACTDITGFGLIGHTLEMAKASDATIEITANQIPLLPLALEMAKQGMLPAGAYKNAEFVMPDVAYDNTVPRELTDLANDPQTSGGLLLALSREDANLLLSRLASKNISAAIIGSVTKKQDKFVVLK